MLSISRFASYFYGVSRYLLKYTLFILPVIISGNAVAQGLSIATLPSAAVEDYPVCYDNSTGALGMCDISLYGSKARMAWVAKDGTGDYSSPTAAMINSDDWCPNPSASNPCLLKIAPGLYNIGTSTLTMADHIDIQGSGKTATFIRGTRTTYGFTSGVVRGANATIGALTIQAFLNSGASVPVVSAIYNTATGFYIEGINVLALGRTTAGGFAYGINSRGGSTFIMDSEIDVQTGDSVRAVYVRNSRVELLRSDISAIGGTASTLSVFTSNVSATSTPIISIHHSNIGTGDLSIGSNTTMHMYLSATNSANITGTGFKRCRGIATTGSFETTACP